MSLVNSIRRLVQPIAGFAAATQQSPSRLGLTETLSRERARADRTGGEFSVVTFAVTGPYSNSDALSRIAKHLARRVRMIDEYGWTGDLHLWLLLHECPPDSAAILARGLCQRFSTQQEVVTYDLYHYPADAHTSGKASRRRQTETHRNGVDEGDWSNGSNTSSNEPSGEAHQPVETFLVRATPRWKRATDLTVAAAALVVLSPMLAIVAVLVKATSHGPIFFKQIRAGKAGKPFRMYKFRTMVVDAEQLKSELLVHNEQDGPAFKIRNDPRITSIGRLLRSTGIDELPQLLNVLRGEMSLVGPRPLPVDEAESCMGWHQERLDITPGLTCSWQVCDRCIEFADWMRMDIRYARNRSPMRDLMLVLRTIAFVIRRKGT